MIIADRYDTSFAIVEYMKLHKRKVIVNCADRTKAMSHVESVSNAI